MQISLPGGVLVHSECCDVVNFNNGSLFILDTVPSISPSTPKPVSEFKTIYTAASPQQLQPESEVWIKGTCMCFDILNFYISL